MVPGYDLRQWWGRAFLAAAGLSLGLVLVGCGGSPDSSKPELPRYRDGVITITEVGTGGKADFFLYPWGEANQLQYRKARPKFGLHSGNVFNCDARWLSAVGTVTVL